MATKYIDPTNGLQTNSGADFANAWKYPGGKALSDGDILRVAMSPETAQAGTATATNGSKSVATTNDLTGTLAQYAHIRFDTDLTLYMIASINSTTITLNRPYRGTTGSGKTVKKLTLHLQAASGDWGSGGYPASFINPIIVQGGVNPANDQVEGFTLLSGNGSVATGGTSATGRYFKRMGWYYFASAGFTGLACCQFDDCFSFRMPMHFDSNNVESIFRRFVCEVCSGHAFYSISYVNFFQGLRFEDLEIFNVGGAVFARNNQDVVIRRLRCGGVTRGIFRPNANPYEITIYDSILAEGGDSGEADFIIEATDKDINILLVNPTFSAGAGKVWKNTGYRPHGKVRIQHYNKVPGDNRVWDFASAAGQISAIVQDDSVYNTAAPSARIDLLTNRIANPKVYLAAEAGVTKTVSAYLRKNSAYTTSPAVYNLPKIIVRWFTGSSGSLALSESEAVMANVTDEFSQVSVADVTPSVDGVIEVEIVAQSNGTGASCWYDDVELT